MPYRSITAAVAAVLGCTVSAVCLPSLASAQPPQAASADQASGDTQEQQGQSNQLQEVVVTAERRATDVQTTAISMQAISNQQLAQAQVETITDLQKLAPSFQINAFGLSDYVNIRGIGESTLGPAITPGVAVLRDGLYEPESQGLSGSFYDIADVELLRGPQGTFVGMSAIGGALQITSQIPNFRGVNGFIDGQLGDYSDTKLTGAVNLPASSTVAVRIAFDVENRGSYYKDVGAVVTPAPSDPEEDPGKDEHRNFRATLLWQPNDSFQALLRADLGWLNNGGPPGSPNLTPLPNGTYSPFYAYSTKTPFLLNYYTLGTQDIQVNNKYSLDLHYTLPGGIVLRSLTGIQTNNIYDIEDFSDSSATPAEGGGTLYDNTRGNNYYSQELDLISPAGPLNWIVGSSVFYRRTPLALAIALDAPVPGVGLVPIDVDIDSISYQRAYGVFGQVNWKFTDTLELQAGLRGNWDANYTRNLLIPAQNTDFDDSVPTAKVGLNYTPIAGQFLYVFYARGYKAGGANPGNTFNPEHVNDYELGWKGDFLDRHLQTSVGGYWEQYQAMQEAIYDPTTGLTPTTNIGNATLRGIEASANGRFGQFNASLNLAYEHTALGNFSNYPDYLLPVVPGGAAGPTQCAPGVVAPYPAPGPGGCLNFNQIAQTASGDVQPYSPELTFTATIDYGIALGSHTLRPSLTYSHTSSQFTDLAQHTNAGQLVNYYLLPARNLLDGSLSFEASAWLVQAYIDNFTNQIYVTSSSGQSVYYGAPRVYGVRFHREF
ncbi:MAG TPA: TonB-dependent receptor [Steroidobacteraceae bacterium]|jgi:iron complex outermembrane receptor protein|nr:TonB-dependent receptor [Steroidobacteraceae bacterium]